MGTRFVPEWLALREEADADARAADLLDLLGPHLRTPLVVRDLGCGTGAMARWLSTRLPSPQQWILTDRDPDLLALAADGLPAVTELRDLAGLTAADLTGTALVTGSALLDVLTAQEVTGLAAACATAGCAALFALTVVGRVEFGTPDPMDAELVAAFNAHQRRRHLLGPDAVAAMAYAFERLGVRVHRRPSPWRLGPDRAALQAEWLRGWVDAACEQRPELASRAAGYLRTRLDECAAGGLRVTVHHEDLLAVPLLS